MIGTATHSLVNIAHDKAIIRPHRGQQQAYLSTARFTFVIAGTQSGKTSFGPLWLAKEIQDNGAGDYLAATATFDLFKLKMLPEMLYFFQSIHGWSWSASARVLVSPDAKTRIILRSANADGGLESATAKAAWLDECGQDAFRLEAWQAVQRRLSLHQGRVLGTTTPYNLGWLKTEIYDRWRGSDPDYRVIQFASLMNPVFPRAEYDRAKRTLPVWKFEMFYNGQFSRPAGLIYSDFSDDVHLIDEFDIPRAWPRYVGIDFGAVNTATVWIAEDQERGRFIVYRETLEGDKTTQQHTALALERGNRENVVLWAGGGPSETQQRMDWTANGVPAREPLIADVDAGIDRVIELLKTKRLYFFRSLPGLRDELGTYSREVDESGQPIEKIRDKETYHRLDALRYAAQHMLIEMIRTEENPFYD